MILSGGSLPYGHASPVIRRPTRSTAPPALRETVALVEQAPEGLPGSLTIAAGALFLARYFVPAESAAQGDTLWITQAWLFLSAIIAWLCARRRVRLRLKPADAAVAVLILGHVVSALSIVLTEGHKRAAINMLWEWMGVGASLFVLRQIITTPDDRSRFLRLVLAAGLVLSGLAVRQHFVTFPENAARFEEWERLEAAPLPEDREQADAQRRRRQELREIFHEVVGLDDSARMGFRQRIRDSREPIGRFALANTLAGLLAVTSILMLAQVRQHFSVRRPTSQRAFDLAMTALVLFALVLTKSRTAWIGVAAGSALIVAAAPLGTRRRRIIATILGAGALVGLLAVAGVLVGGLDEQVLTEAPKSLRYRLEYWSTTWRIIQEHPWLGAGPGNFRQAYVHHKPPGASEEILDPHNFLLDVWANGGLPAVLGLVALLVLIGRNCRRTWSASPQAVGDDAHFPAEDGTAGAMFRSVGAIGAAALSLVFLHQFLFEATWDVELLWLLGGWVIAAFGLARNQHGFGMASASLAATVALLIHLLGAGGIAMPAIFQTLLLLGLVFPNRGDHDRTTSGDAASRRTLVVAAGAAILSVACLQSATLPVLRSRAAMEAGRTVLSLDRNLSRAERDFAEAANADPLDPSPPTMAAFVEFLRWQRRDRAASAAFDRGMEHLRDAINRDPYDAGLYRTGGEWLLKKWLRNRSPADAQAAAEWFQTAAEQYPHHAAIRAQYAEALSAAGHADAAREEAGRALELDDLNQLRGHYDKLLPDATRTRLRNY